MQFFVPAEKALLPCLVTGEHLIAANSLNALNGNLGMFIGSAIGGAMMGLTGLTSVILFDCASYLLAGMMIFLISWSPGLISKKIESPDSFKVWSDLWREWLTGLTLVKRSRTISVIFVAAAMAMLGEGIIQALLVPFVNLLEGGAMEFGLLLTLRGLGGLLGGFIFGQVGRFVPPHRAFPWTLSGIGLSLLFMFNNPVLIVALVVLCITGMMAVGASVTSTTMLQSGVPNTYLGRIFGVMGMIAASMTLIGQGSASAFADRWGVVVMLNIGGFLYVLSGLILLALLRNPSSSRLENMDDSTAKN